MQAGEDRGIGVVARDDAYASFLLVWFGSGALRQLTLITLDSGFELTVNSSQPRENCEKTSNSKQAPAWANRETSSQFVERLDGDVTRRQAPKQLRGKGNIVRELGMRAKASKSHKLSICDLSTASSSESTCSTTTKQTRQPTPSLKQCRDCRSRSSIGRAKGRACSRCSRCTHWQRSGGML